MRKQDRTRTLNSYKSNPFYSEHLLWLMLPLLLIALSLLYWNHFKINRYNTAKLANNIAYSKNISENKAIIVANSAVSVNDWYAKYQQLQNAIIKQSGIAQTSLENDNFISLSASCQQLKNSLLAAKKAPIIPNQIAQEYWSQAQTYYQSAVKLCNSSQIIVSRSSSNLILNDLKHGDQLLLNSIKYILNCC
ncbi:MAG: hypothetical protein M1554_02315 [Patescibacteria group bacterium]|jgi:hypothetical protein|nr:hypothetical protein [Patescibacteria group bacterium]